MTKYEKYLILLILLCWAVATCYIRYNDIKNEQMGVVVMSSDIENIEVEFKGGKGSVKDLGSAFATIYNPQINSIDVTQSIAHHNDGITSSSDIYMEDVAEELGRVDLPLDNGKYAVWNTKTGEDGIYYAGIYDKDKSQLGLLIIDKSPDYKSSAVVLEYVKDKENPFDVYLQHIIYYNKDLDSFFVYGNDGKLELCRYNGEIKSVNENDIENPEFLEEFYKLFVQNK